MEDEAKLVEGALPQDIAGAQGEHGERVATSAAELDEAARLGASPIRRGWYDRRARHLPQRVHEPCRFAPG